MEPYMNLFEFTARMWRGAANMIALQEEVFGEQIEFTGAELADIIAFLHDENEQHKFSEADIPPQIMPMMSHMHGETGGGAQLAEPGGVRVEQFHGALQMRIERLAGQEQPHDLRGAFDDRVDSGVAHHALHGIGRLTTGPQRQRALVASPGPELHGLVDDAP